MNTRAIIWSIHERGCLRRSDLCGAWKGVGEEDGGSEELEEAEDRAGLVCDLELFLVSAVKGDGGEEEEEEEVVDGCTQRTRLVRDDHEADEERAHEEECREESSRLPSEACSEEG